jgi:phosphoribosylformylglycinamidine synthase
MDLLKSGFPQWEFEAEWIPPEQRGLREPVLGAPHDLNRLLLDMLERPNICSTEWIVRQYDHEVQGGSVVKPLVGADRDVNSDAAVLRPVLSSRRGLAFAQALLPTYSAIDAYHMAACSIDEAVRRVLAVGGDFEHIGGVDNFCWPSIQHHSVHNPDGKFKAAQLVRACWALRDLCLDYGIPLLSGKDSMYVDGHLAGRYGETTMSRRWRPCSSPPSRSCRISPGASRWTVRWQGTWCTCWVSRATSLADRNSTSTSATPGCRCPVCAARRSSRPTGP